MNNKILARGMCACKGKVEGIAVLAFDSSASLGGIENAILVCPQTDPAYTPLIFKARAVVTDYGGIACHAAIIARELGIPCIVGTSNGTQSIQNGQSITVDATNGVVYG